MGDSTQQMRASGEQERLVDGTAQLAVVHLYGAAGFGAVGAGFGTGGGFSDPCLARLATPLSADEALWAEERQRQCAVQAVRDSTRYRQCETVQGRGSAR